MKPFIPAALAAAGLALAGCQQSEQDRVRDTVTTFIHAYADGDAKTVCSLLTPEVKKAFKGGGCEAEIKKEHAALSKQERDRLHSLEVTTVSITGDSAQARLKGQGGEPGTLRKVDGKWLVENR